MSEEPTTIDIAVSPAFDGKFAREDMNQVEVGWDGRYDTVLALRFDGSVDDAAREEDEAPDVRELDDWRRRWQ